MNMLSTPFRFSMLTKRGLQKTARRMPSNLNGTAFRPYEGHGFTRAADAMLANPALAAEAAQESACESTSQT
jgi:hypothetical protein